MLFTLNKSCPTLLINIPNFCGLNGCRVILQPGLCKCWSGWMTELSKEMAALHNYPPRPGGSTMNHLASPLSAVERVWPASSQSWQWGQTGIRVIIRAKWHRVTGQGKHQDHQQQGNLHWNSWLTRYCSELTKCHPSPLSSLHLLEFHEM